jgi:hypothetical protein
LVVLLVLFLGILLDLLQLPLGGHSEHLDEALHLDCLLWLNALQFIGIY